MRKKEGSGERRDEERGGTRRKEGQGGRRNEERRGRRNEESVKMKKLLKNGKRKSR